jgi:hypothetical protein
MKSRILPTLTVSIFVTGPPIGVAGPVQPELDEFCTEAQSLLAATALPSENVLYDDLDSFVKSKAALKPLVTRQFVHYDAEDRGLAKMISCKLKSCRSINGLTLKRVQSARGKPDSPWGVFTNVVLEPDEIVPSGFVWVKPYAMVRVDDRNILHIKSKALFVSWHDERFLNMPARFRGTHYCHLIAPSYLRRLLDGEVVVAPADM